MFGIPNPQWLLQPWKNLTHFTEELYAALRSQAPVTRDGPVTIRVREGQQGLRLERSPEPEPSGPAFPARPRVAAPDSLSSKAGTPRQRRLEAPRLLPILPDSGGRSATIGEPEFYAGTSWESPGVVENESRSSPTSYTAIPARTERPAAMFSTAGPAEFQSEFPTRFRRPPEIFNESTKTWYTPPAWEFPSDLPFPSVGGGGGGSTISLGQVQSCLPGGPATVVLYPNGVSGGAGQEVEVDLPTINDTEQLDGVTWLSNIYQYTDENNNVFYECYPPIWS